MHFKLIAVIITPMGNFDRNRNSRPGGGGRGFERRGGFGDRGSRGPAEMHQAVCDKCRQNCEVPFRPTSGKPVYCSNCFKSNGDFSAKGGPASGWDERRMFDATCDECRNRCQVPFQPSGGKPVYCSNCFGEKKGAADPFAQLNNKLDQILLMLAPKNDFAPPAVVEEEIIEETPKKKPSKKK